VLQLSSFLFAQNYLWPTDASKYLTSSFCEYRPGHYHAALDIKTWNKEGYKCFAIDDGVIERINISPHGAGKALYIKLKDGRKAVYFHLQKFSDELESKIREVQLAQKSYSVEWWPQNWKVKKGDFIAYTGQTGIGVPHLHFEIRDELNRPLNPLKFYNDVKDRIRPQLKRLLVIPQEKSSRVNGSFIPAQYDLTYIHDGVFIIKEPIHVKGTIGLALNGYDMANGVSNKFAWYQVSMTVNGQKVFQYAYDRVSFKTTRFVDVDVYYPEKKNSGRSYNKLFLEPFNLLDFYNRKLGNGLINVNESKVPFEIEVKDFIGNTSILRGNLLTEKQEISGPKLINKNTEATFISLKIPDNLRDIKFSSGENLIDLKPVEYFEIVERQKDKDGSLALIKIRVVNSGDKVVRAIVENTMAEKDTIFSAVKMVEKKVRTHFQLMGKNLYFLFENLSVSEYLKLSLLQKNDTISYPIQINGDVSEFILPANDIKTDSLRFILQDNNYVYVDSSVTVLKMIPGQAKKYSLFSDSLQIATGTLNAFDTLLFNAEFVKLNKDAFDLPVFSEGILVNAGKHILNSRVDLSLKIDFVSLKAEQIGFYSVAEDELDYAGGRYDPQSGFVTNRQKNFSTFVVAADTTAPTIELLNFRENGSYNKVSAFRFKVTDNASGIGTDKNIEVYLDDQYLIPEWDPETDIVKSIVHFKPQQGKHKVTIICKDRAANIFEKVVSINIL